MNPASGDRVMLTTLKPRVKGRLPMIKVLASALVALALTASVTPSIAQETGNSSCWQAFKKNRPACREKSVDEKGGSVATHEAHLSASERSARRAGK
jgi:hypothetical protein